MIRAHDRPDPPTALPVCLDLHPHRINHLEQIITHQIRHLLKERALIPKRVVVQLQALELDALPALLRRSRLVAERDDPEVRVTGERTDRGELLGNVLDHKRRIRRRIKDF